MIDYSSQATVEETVTQWKVTLLLILLNIYLSKKAVCYVLNTWRKSKRSSLKKKFFQMGHFVHSSISSGFFNFEQFIVYSTGNVAATVV